MTKAYSITDKPIEQLSDDLLKVERYAEAMGNFIEKSETPITIGLQGEWGTGKTSLMYLLRERLQGMNVATSWVNTWEYSMFRGASETTPAVLQGLLLKLKIACGDKWTVAEKTEEKLKKIGRFFGALSNQLVAAKTGLDIRGAASEISDSQHSVIAEIAEVKSDIADIIDLLINDPKNPYKRVVFFIDDLDRINPVDAVEVLEALKNIFDIPHCVFVLAIDYEVVVKGLEGKFGKKTEANEREFRSFFDKIIQLPFSMPIGTYDIDNFLAKKMKELGVELDEDKNQLFAGTVRNTVGYNPRSLKRYLNSFSLLNSIRRLESESEDEIDAFILFALLGLQISYPKIFRLMTGNINFPEWDKTFASRQGLNWDTINETVDSYGENELTDEEWERVVWGLCQSDTYLKSRTYQLLELLNSLKSTYGDELESALEEGMRFAAITSVDDDIVVKQAVQKVGQKTRYAGMDIKLEALKRQGLNEQGLETWVNIWSHIESKLSALKDTKINYAKTASTWYIDNRQIIYAINPSKNSSGFRMWIKTKKEFADLNYDAIMTQYNINKQYYHLDAYNQKGEHRVDLVLQKEISEVMNKDLFNEMICSLVDKIADFY